MRWDNKKNLTSTINYVQVVFQLALLTEAVAKLQTKTPNTECPTKLENKKTEDKYTKDYREVRSNNNLRSLAPAIGESLIIMIVLQKYTKLQVFNNGEQ